MGHANVAYIDDSLLQSNTFEDCENNIIDTITLFDQLGFTVHPKKSVLVPTQQISFLGFVLNSVHMIVHLTEDKATDIAKLCLRVRNRQTLTIREWAQLVGKLVACEPGVQYGPLHVKALERLKDTELKAHHGNYDSVMTLTTDVLWELDWWIDNISSSFNPVTREDPTFIITTDSSDYGWGAVVTDSDLYTSGLWSYGEQRNHINFLELKAAWLSLKSFCADMTDGHVRFFMDNMVAISYISNMGGKCEGLNNLARKIWFWCVERNIWISASHIPGVDNVEADRLSRKMNSDLEWQLRPSLFQCIASKYGDNLSIDMFASRINIQIPVYVSYLPDPQALAVDAFSMKWSNEHGIIYLFPPFSVIDRVLQKLVEDQATAVMVAPIWTTQPWFPGLLSRITGNCYLLPHVNNSLVHPAFPDRQHPLQKMRLGVFLLSGNNSLVEEFHHRLPVWSSIPGKTQRRNSMGVISKNGCSFAYRDKMIHLNQL
ncbi:uncharacterized protein LOC117341798 [Pecten maximus]|uniref:uncharacterized protein LOC117341798 n=1 Tax=Pecten maximus TaxID=6579 RepID=UPI001458B06D|nr:uncharacterized protein LOC117341798 [Pecten maximus]